MAGPGGGLEAWPAVGEAVVKRALELVPERLPNAAAARWLVHDVRDHDEEQEQQETQDVEATWPPDRNELEW